VTANTLVKFSWRPSAEQRRSANVARLAERLGCDDFASLHRLSVDEPERFWAEVVDDLDIEFSQPWERVLDESDGIEWARWFVGARVNVARACVHRWADERPDQEAAVWQAEDGERRTLTWRELSREVYRLAEGLASLGIGEGDTVGIYLPMSPEAAIASHAVAHLGAVQVPIFSGFAAPAVAARLADARAKLLITADGTLRRGRAVEMKEAADEALRDAPTVAHTVVWRRLGRDDVPMVAGRDVYWDELVEGRDGAVEPVEVDS
jgi:acetyl-CoA synthetase